MPAIQPVKLRMQTTKLAELFDRPVEFMNELRHILNLYADNTYRPGRSGNKPRLLQTHNTPTPVLRQITLAVKPYASIGMEATLAIGEMLWKDEILESRILAGNLLGLAPADQPERILEYLQRWLMNAGDERVEDTLLNQGTVQLRRIYPQELMALAEAWLSNSKLHYQQIGLRLMHILARDETFENLPIIFHAIAPLLHKPQQLLRPDLLNLLAEMARRAPQETSYILQQNLNTLDNSDTAWIIRQIIDVFSPEVQQNLRQAMRENT